MILCLNDITDSRICQYVKKMIYKKEIAFSEKVVFHKVLIAA